MFCRLDELFRDHFQAFETASLQDALEDIESEESLEIDVIFSRDEKSETEHPFGNLYSALPSHLQQQFDLACVRYIKLKQSAITPNELLDILGYIQDVDRDSESDDEDSKDAADVLESYAKELQHNSTLSDCYLMRARYVMLNHNDPDLEFVKRNIMQAVLLHALRIDSWDEFANNYFSCIILYYGLTLDVETAIAKLRQYHAYLPQEKRANTIAELSKLLLSAVFDYMYANPKISLAFYKIFGSLMNDPLINDNIKAIENAFLNFNGDEKLVEYKKTITMGLLMFNMNLYDFDSEFSAYSKMKHKLSSIIQDIFKLFPVNKMHRSLLEQVASSIDRFNGITHGILSWDHDNPKALRQRKADIITIFGDVYLKVSSAFQIAMEDCIYRDLPAKGSNKIQSTKSKASSTPQAIPSESSNTHTTAEQNALVNKAYDDLMNEEQKNDKNLSSPHKKKGKKAKKSKKLNNVSHSNKTKVASETVSAVKEVEYSSQQPEQCLAETVAKPHAELPKEVESAVNEVTKLRLPRPELPWQRVTKKKTVLPVSIFSNSNTKRRTMPSPTAPSVSPALVAHPFVPANPAAAPIDLTQWENEFPALSKASNHSAHSTQTGNSEPAQPCISMVMPKSLGKSDILTSNILPPLMKSEATSTLDLPTEETLRVKSLVAQHKMALRDQKHTLHASYRSTMNLLNLQLINRSQEILTLQNIVAMQQVQNWKLQNYITSQSGGLWVAPQSVLQVNYSIVADIPAPATTTPEQNAAPATEQPNIIRRHSLS